MQIGTIMQKKEPINELHKHHFLPWDKTNLKWTDAKWKNCHVVRRSDIYQPAV